MAPKLTCPPILTKDPLHITVTPDDLIPVQRSGESRSSTSKITYIELFKRNILVCFHSASSTDFNEYAWILEYGATEFWYTKPSPSWFREQDTLKESGQSPCEMPAMNPARPVCFHTPMVRASAALVTPSDDDCEESKVLDRTSLAYYIVFSSFQGSESSGHGAHFNGKKVFKLVKRGTRKGAIAEIYYAAGAIGWTVEFSCIFRDGERFTGNAKRVEKLLELCEEDGNGKDEAKVFY